MRIVSEQSDKDIAKHHALMGAGQALRDLTTNLMRITRGAGAAYDIVRQLSVLIERLDAYRQVCGHWPSDYELSKELSIEPDQEWVTGLGEERSEEHYAIRTVIRGALQMAASELAGHHLQVAAGEKELYDGLNSLERVREERRKRWAEERRKAPKVVSAVAARAALASARARTKKPKGKK